MFCEQCGNKLPENAMFCPKCGTPAPKDDDNIEVQNGGTKSGKKPKKTQEEE